jgi:flagellar hook-associated protein 1 FlgK
MASLNSAAEPGQLGTGVQVSSITRSRDAFLDNQVRREKGTLGKFQSREEFLSEIETIFMEPSDTGLSTNMTKFWDSWNQLHTTPESSTAKTLVVQNGQDLANAINHNYEQLERLQTNAGDIIKEQIFDLNSTLKQVQDLNVQIKAVVVGGQTPNDLMDRRDLLLDKLSERFGFDVEETDFNGIKINAKLENGQVQTVLTDGTINAGVSYINNIYKDGNKWKADLYLGGQVNDLKTVEISNIDDYAELDDKGNVKAIKAHTVFYDGVSQTLDGQPNGPAAFQNGSLTGYESIGKEINNFKFQLNKLAKVIAISVNTIHSNRFDDKNYNGDQDFFNHSAESDSEPAKSIAVRQTLVDDPMKINAGKVIGGNAGNGERALLLGQLRNVRMDILTIDSREKFAANVGYDPNNTNTLKITSSKSGATMDSYFKDSVANLGVLNQEAKRMVKNQEQLLAGFQEQKDSISGVSLDEEMANMVQFQHAYQANAKIISVVDQLLDVVVNGLVK